MSDLRHGEWRLTYPGTDYTFGTRNTPAWHLTTPDVGDVDLRLADVDRPRQDGRAFGVDYRGGRTVSFEMGLRAHTSEETRQAAQDLAAAWRADAVRQTPGAVAALSTCYDGRERLVFGRPRRLALNYSDVTVNQYASAVADFACADDLFYAPTVESVTFGLAGGVGGGLIAPLAAPLATTASSDRSVSLRVVTEMPVWPVVTIHGPITNAVVNLGTLATFEVRLSLNYDEYVVIDTQPWARSALRNGTAPVTGSVRGTRLAKAALPAGNYEVGLKGVDPTGTSSVTVAWRPAFSSL